uniref:Uncharacterized protein n=2 Tax=Kalanchoe fedtschenkoi TaxID=63787 RepID=A0A7N0V7L7_KALFE
MTTMAAASYNAPFVRSSLEEMLESLQRRDDKPADLPPALPSRPSSKARLPSSRKSLPVNFKVGDENASSSFRDKEETLRGSFGRRIKKKDVEQPGESPYAGMIGEKRKDGLRVDRSVSDLQPILSPRSRQYEWEDDIGYFIKKKLSVWCRLSSGLWVLGRIQSTSGDKVLLLLSDGRVIKALKGDLFPANPDILDGADDLMQLNFLNEPSVLHNLQYRYSKDLIYCKAGPLLISVNPLKDLHIYEDDILTAYRLKLVDIPHVYATVNTAYTEMRKDGQNQSIILCGESGAGKTETAKHVIEYLTFLTGGDTGMRRKINHSSFILEAFGKAQTSMNDNASRYGKLTEFHFTLTGKICCSRVQTFFLEKSRVVQLCNGERSFHIFYQLCAGATESMKARLNLKAPSFYKYLNKSESMIIPGVDDEQRFHSLVEALETVGICKEDQEHVFAMVAAVLWLGNIIFSEGSNGQVEVVADDAVSTVSRLLECSTFDLITSLCAQTTLAERENKLTFQQATASRDALASYIYVSLFEWLVEEINKSFEAGKGHSVSTISVLDIFGFDTSSKNSFEQLCINYANERLQQHYYRHLLKLVQEEFELDGIDFSKVHFQDNQDCLGLFEKIPRGFFSLLDEESNLAKASDMTFANKLKQYLSGNSCYKSEQGGKFTIRHYAGEVTYDMDGFLTKNKDSLHSNSVQLLASCSGHLPQCFNSKLLQQCGSSGKSNCLNRNMGTEFKGRIFKLIQQLESSTPHFIVCVRPNSKQLPDMFEKELVSKQLRCFGIVEVVKMHGYGYPTRMTHQEFASRFRILLGDTDNISEDPLSIASAILQRHRIPPTSYQVGNTRLFFRTGQIDQLEVLKNKALEGALDVQKLSQKQYRCPQFEAMKTGVITLQSFIRGENSRREYSVLKKLPSKELLSLRTLQRSQKTVIQLQSAIRGWLARQQFSRMQSANRFSNKMANSPKTFGTETPKGLPEENIVMSPSNMEDIRVQLVKAEATLGQKEQENAALQLQLQQLQSKWSAHEEKMRIMEDAWQQQMKSLQTSLAAAKNSLAADNPPAEPRRFMVSPSPFSDSEDAMSMGNQTGTSSPRPRFGSIPESHPGQESNGKSAPLGHLAKEFEQRKQILDDEAKSLGSHHYPEQQLRQLKLRFAQWKRDFKVRLREAKAKLRKQGHADMERSHRKWWGKKHRKPT